MPNAKVTLAMFKVTHGVRTCAIYIIHTNSGVRVRSET